MDKRTVGAFLLCLGLLGVVAIGGTAGAQPTGDTVTLQTTDGPLDDAERDAGAVAHTLRNATGEVEVIVSLPESNRASSPAGLQAHASETQQPLLAFAQDRPGVTVENRFWLANVALVTVDTRTTSLTDLAAVEGVQELYENREFEVHTGAASGVPAVQSPEVTANSYTYGLEQINAPTAWETHNTTGEGASVAVLDTGVAADHPDLSVAKWQEFDGDGNPIDSEPNDGQGHGTHVSGTVSGAMDTDGDVPAYGVAPGVDLYGGKVLDDSGGGSFAQIIAGMEWAVEEDADIISMSLGATGFFDQMIEPVQNAHEAGTVVVVSAGNSGEGSSGSPGNVYDSIAVGASNSDQGIAGFSSGEVVNTGSAWSDPPASWPDQYTVPTVAAPGVNVLSSVPGGGYDDSYSGTSMAAPHVSGVVALAESALDDELSPAEIEQALEVTAFKPGDAPAPPGERDTRYGSGIVDANAFIAFLDGLEDEPFLTLAADGPATVEPNESLTVEYTIENIGGVEGTESAVNLLVNETVEDTVTNVTVGSNETVTGTLTFEDVDEYDEGELIEWTVELADSGTTTGGSTGVGLLPGTEIAIQSLDYPDQVPPTGSLTVEYTLENLGIESGTESFVDLKVEGTDSGFDDTDSDVTVPGGETVTGTLTLDTVEAFFNPGDIINFSVELFSFGNVATGSTTVEVPDEPVLQLASTTAPGSVEPNETLTVGYTIENVGSVEGTESAVNLLINGTVEDTDENVTVPATGAANGTLTFDDVDEYEEGDVIEWTVELVDEGETASGSTGVGLQPGTEIVVQSLSYPDPVSPGSDLTVEYTLENLGFEDGTESFVDLKVDGTDSTFDDTDTNVAVPGGETTNGTLTFDAVGEFFDGGDTITFTVSLFTHGDEQTASTTVETPDGPALQLASATAPDSVDTNETLTVAYTIENAGDAEGTESAVNLLINGTVEDTDENVTVPATGTADGTLTFDDVDEYEEGDIIEWTVELADTGDTASDSTAVGLQPGTEIVVQSLSYPDPVSPNSDLTVEYTLENLGAKDGTESFVDLKVEGTDSAFDDTDTDVTVPGGETTNGTLTFDAVEEFFEAGDTITFTVSLFTHGDEQTASTTVEVPDEPVLELQSVDAPTTITAGDDLVINYTVENIGSVEGTESAVNLLVNETVEDTDENVTVPATGTASGTLVLENADGSALPTSVTVAAGDEHLESSSSVQVDRALGDATGTVEAVVSLPGLGRTASQDSLQTHASETQQPLVRFAQDRPGVTVESRFWLTNAVLVTIDTSTVSVSDLAAVEGVQAIHKNTEFRINTGSVAPPVMASDGVSPMEYTYGLEQINVPTAWETHNTTGEGASIAVLDTGVAADHPDLDVAKWQEFDSDGNPVDSEPNDGQGHGTHVSGTATGAQEPAGDVPAFGVAPDADLYGVKVLDDSGGGSFAQIIAGMEWAVQEDADVISMSLGANGFFDQMIDPVQNAVDAGTVVVASAGNSGEGSSGSPGNVYDTIAVGASNSNGGIAGFSSGAVVDTTSDWSSPPSDWPSQYTVPSIAAPGVDTLSSVPGGGYDDTYSGTSMAAPHVSGVVALAESALDKNLSAAEIEQALEQTAFKPGDSPAPPGERDTRYGSGIVDANAAIAFLDGLEDEPFLTLSADGPATVEPNESLTVEYTIENIGGVEGTESAVNLLVNGTAEDTVTNVTVGPDESVNGSLTLDNLDGYEEGDIIEWTVELADSGTTTSGSTGVGLLPGTEIVIQSLDYADSLPPEGNLTVEYTLENLGFEDGTESFVDLKVDGTDLPFDDTDSDVTVPGGETVTGTLTLADPGEYFDLGETITFTVALFDFDDSASGETTLGDGDLIDWTVGLTDFNDTTSGQVLVEEPEGEAEFQIVDAETNTPLPEGETLEVGITVENIGTLNGSQTVTAHSDGLGTNATTVELAPGETADHTLTIDIGTGPDYVGTHTMAVESEDHSVEMQAEIHVPTMPGQDDPPQDVDGDDRYEDVDGDEDFDIFDVQMFFSHFDDPMMNDHGWAFNFDDKDEVTIFDVQALFEEL